MRGGDLQSVTLLQTFRVQDLGLGFRVTSSMVWNPEVYIVWALLGFRLTLASTEPFFQVGLFCLVRANPDP